MALCLHAATVRADAAHQVSDSPVASLSTAADPKAGELAEALAAQPGYLDDKIDAALQWRQQERERNGYVARGDSVRDFFNALSARLKKPVIVSKKAGQRKVSGDFDLGRPQQALEEMARQLGLIWYHDGQSIYVYEASEVRNAVISLSYITIGKLRDFLQQSGLYDRRYPFRGSAGSKVFYLAAPPVYVDLVTNTANFLDSASTERALGNLKIGVVRLQNTFVGDRSFTVREKTSVVPGMASVIEEILRDEKVAIEMDRVPSMADRANASPLPSPNATSDLASPVFSANGADNFPSPRLPPAAKRVIANAPTGQSDNPIRVLAYPDSNSLLIKGTPEQVTFIENLIATLDVVKRHVELSLWIIDMEASQLDQLGVQWEGGFGLGNLGGVTFNAPLSTLDGARFIASVKALNAKQKARIASRPVVLTQENIPAFFDNSRTFYVKLQGERAVQLEQVTFGTLIKVLPRFAVDGEIEMSLDIEDGSEVVNRDDKQTVDSMPKVARTRISTVARVPKGRSLLVGGYTRDQDTEEIRKIPGLGSLPLIGGLFRSKVKQESNMVRVFLIEPRYNEDARSRDASDLVDDLVGDMPAIPAQDLLRDYLDRRHGN